MWLIKYEKLDRLWQVGHYDPDKAWIVLEELDSLQKAIAWVHYLNGGKWEIVD
jgi:uncharacterized Fe-S cluster-containing MiaB family protein